MPVPRRMAEIEFVLQDWPCRIGFVSHNRTRVPRPPGRVPPGKLGLFFPSHFKRHTSNFRKIGFVSHDRPPALRGTRPRPDRELGVLARHLPGGQLASFRTIGSPRAGPQIPQPAQVWLCFPRFALANWVCLYNRPWPGGPCGCPAARLP